MIYKVKIENFEGPMDLLLFFIQRDRLNIYDIPITHITSEFIKVKGRSNTVGRPLLFATTELFLESLGLEKVSDLPNLKELSDLRGEDPDLFTKDHAIE
jgi:segregation and condensation protein A